jgi:bifunctional UDP-N-acetylglucosamine pyrophosphorylase/glucosamine-1-phosphate N-acetyltransferase
MRADIIILAAGQGSRMKSDYPKVLHKIAGKPMLEHVILTATETQKSIGEGKIHVVIGHESDKIKQKLGKYNLNWVYQEQQLGTGHAVQQAIPYCKGADMILVLYGDVPLISSMSLESLLLACNGNRLALLTINITNPSGYGRIIRDGFGKIQAIVEDKDATSEQLAINEVNTGIIAIPGKSISAWINKLKNNNSQKEYYLTDIVAMAVENKVSVVHVQPGNAIEVDGVNSKLQLMELERTYQKQKAISLMLSGVTILDPSRIDIRGELSTEHDIIIDINVIIEGKVTIEKYVTVESGCIIRNSYIKAGAHIKANSIIEDSIVGENCNVGPFARLRPGTKLSNDVNVGNFVEIKNSTVATYSKINHLSYIGDSTIGEQVNIGAGTITCNYDGENKHQTIIEDNTFIGSNSALIAPVTIAYSSTVAAGSVITDDVPKKALSIARGRQKNIENWKRKNT